MIELNTVPEPLDVPYEAVTVREVARYTPTDGMIWPAALDFRGQTAWMWEDDEPVLIVGTKANSSDDGNDADETDSHAKFLIWRLFDDSIEHQLFDPQPPENTWQPIPSVARWGSENGILSNITFTFVSPGGESSTRAVTIDDGEPLGLPTIDLVKYYDPGIVLPVFLSEEELVINDYELAAGDFLAPVDRNSAQGLVFMDYRDHPVLMPDGTTRLATNWGIIWFDCMLEVTPLNPAIEMTFGAELTGFLGSIFFFVGESPYDSLEYTFISSLDETIAIPTWRNPNDPESAPKILRITGYIPAVRWGSTSNSINYVVFAEYGESENDSTYIAAIHLNLIDLRDGDHSIIWASEVPNIFGVSTVIPVVHNDLSRPYIVCLDPLTGEITVFDPLLGSIRFQDTIKLAEWTPGDNLASFCVNFDPDPMRPIVFIHDPNANEIIELEIETREPVEGGSIVPVGNQLSWQ